MYVEGPPPSQFQRIQLCADIHRAHNEDCCNYRSLCFPLSGFLPLLWPRKWQCLAFTSQRSTAVTMAVASARPSPPVHALRTAVDMRRLSGSALGKNSSFQHFLCIFPVCISVNYGIVRQGSITAAITPHPGVLMLYPFFPSWRLSEDRVGDICNACVLLVKRWKKLPNGSKKNWNHVSDVSPYKEDSYSSLLQL